MDINQEFILPLRDDIEDKFGNVIVLNKRKEDTFYLYRSDLFGCVGNPIISYDDMTKLFRFENNYYTESQFKRVLDLLVFI